MSAGLLVAFCLLELDLLLGVVCFLEEDFEWLFEREDDCLTFLRGRTACKTHTHHTS